MHVTDVASYIISLHHAYLAYLTFNSLSDCPRPSALIKIEAAHRPLHAGRIAARTTGPAAWIGSASMDRLSSVMSVTSECFL